MRTVKGKKEFQSILTSQSGVTLIELMVTVAIVAILAAVAYPSYTSHIRKARRTEAKTALLKIQVEQEKYFLKENRYATLAEIYQLASLKVVDSKDFTVNQYYEITFPTRTDTSYEAQADTRNSQTSDTACPTYKIDSSGTKTPNTGCW